MRTQGKGQKMPTVDAAADSMADNVATVPFSRSATGWKAVDESNERFLVWIELNGGNNTDRFCSQGFGGTIID